MPQWRRTTSGSAVSSGQHPRTAWGDLRAAAANLWHVLVTPREVQSDEQAAIKFCQKMRAMGMDGESALGWAAYLAAAGARQEQVNIFAKIIARGRVGSEELHRLEQSGIRIMLKREAHGSDS